MARCYVVSPPSSATDHGSCGAAWERVGGAGGAIVRASPLTAQDSYSSFTMYRDGPEVWHKPVYMDIYRQCGGHPRDRIRGRPQRI